MGVGVLAEWGGVWVALLWGGGAVGGPVKKIKCKGERDIPVSMEHRCWRTTGRKWLSRLPKLSCNLAGESRRFDWLGSARLCEPKPKAWLGSAHQRCINQPAQGGSALAWLQLLGRCNTKHGAAAGGSSSAVWWWGAAA